LAFQVLSFIHIDCTRLKSDQVHAKEGPIRKMQVAPNHSQKANSRSWSFQ